MRMRYALLIHDRRYWTTIYEEKVSNGHVLCYKRLPKKWVYKVRLLIHQAVVRNIDEFYITNETVTCVVAKLNKRYRLKLIRGYDPAFYLGGNQVAQFYEELEFAMQNVRTL